MPKYHVLPSSVLTKYEIARERKDIWNYRVVIRMLSFLTNSPHPELSFSVYQFTRFYGCLKLVHEQIVRRRIQCLLSTKRLPDSEKYSGLFFKVHKSTIIDVYVDISFTGQWNKSWSQHPSSFLSRAGYIVSHADFTMIWLSK